MTVTREWGKVLYIIAKVIGNGQPAICAVFPLALLSEVAMFALFQCFSIPQHSRLFIVCVCVCVCVCEIKGTGLLSTYCWPVTM
jgi:hypothetical protein